MIAIRYASIRPLDISNGEGVGVSLFVQGCHFHCENCFNQSTWDFNGGKEWTEDNENKFFKLIDRPHIKRVSILGGEPLADENTSEVLKICKQIRLLFGNTKTIWLYTGYSWNEVFDKVGCIYQQNFSTDKIIRREIIKHCDVLVDGRYLDELKDQSYPYAGSTNQRVIDVTKSLQRSQIVLWNK
ncbi:anaerobic ribonucleoside-triphosphate reductase activating protein [Lacrimispora sphenoides]|uniref:anaerobic ribonucleoside-triphosphate reductase activating protein n=1 Tax=Lacrimispora sphenoides TaxID=29370 RepID=UPI001FA75916|nr:anaerobic ribonucleoside-triphosphate reductase activating protein [Lacrimispora sphenoides]